MAPLEAIEILADFGAKHAEIKEDEPDPAPKVTGYNIHG